MYNLDQVNFDHPIEQNYTNTPLKSTKPCENGGSRDYGPSEQNRIHEDQTCDYNKKRFSKLHELSDSIGTTEKISEPEQPIKLKGKKNKGEESEVQIKRILKSESKKKNSPLLQTLFNLKPTDIIHFPTQSMAKADQNEKADCFMEVERDGNKTIYKISIKFVGSGDCSIVNQDHRAKSAYAPNWRNREEGVLFHCLEGLDSLIIRLNYDRADGKRSQDILFTDIDFTEVERNAMEALLVHHTFVGAGTGVFQHHVQANCILLIGNVQNTNTWSLTPCFTVNDKKKYVQSKWDKYKLAIRNKGMQVEKSYSKDAQLTPNHQLSRWVSVWAVPHFINRAEQKGYSYPIDGCEYVGNWWEKPKCTLNIRMKK